MLPEQSSVSHPLLFSNMLTHIIDKGQLLSLVDHAIMGKIPNRSPPTLQAVVDLFQILTYL